jgi:hypothetical protein
MDVASPRFSNRVLAWSSAVIVLIIILLILTCAEMIARHAEQIGSSGGLQYQPDPQMGWLPKPGKYKITTPEFAVDASINSLNMNDREFNQSDLALPYRILALGDSHTFAIGVSTMETWPKRLEARLFPKALDGVVWNAGVIGYSIGQYLERFRLLQPVVKPTLVLVGFSMATDLYDLIPPERGGFVYGGDADRIYFDLGDNGELVEKVYHRAARKAALAKQSTDVTISIRGYQLYRKLKRSRLAMWIAVHYHPNGRSLWPGTDTALKRQLSEDDKYRWLLAERLLGKLVKEANAAGAKVVVVNIPYLAQVYDDVWTWSFGTQPEKYDRWIASRRLAQLCKRVGAGYIDTTGAFAAAARQRNHWLHWHQDAHPTPEGQDLISQVVAENLLKLKLVNTGFH